MFTSEACIKKFVEDYGFRLSKKLLEVYQIAIRQMINFCEKPYDNITSPDIRSWLNHLYESGYKSSSIKTKMFGLRLFYKYCIEEDLITHNPVKSIPLPKDEDKLPHYLTNEQLSQLRLQCESNLILRAIIEVLYTTGVRLSELVSMKLEDFNWEERTIRIPKGKGKKERIVLFTKECAEHLEAYLHNRCDNLSFVFVNRYCTSSVHRASVQNWLKPYGKKMGIQLTPHTFRHTFAAHLALKGMPLATIQALLGHDNPKNTLIYTRLYQEAQKQIYDQWM